MPKLSEKLVQGDNELLSFIAEEFEKKGYQIVGASEILPDLLLDEGFICRVLLNLFLEILKRLITY